MTFFYKKYNHEKYCYLIPQILNFWPKCILDLMLDYALFIVVDIEQMKNGFKWKSSVSHIQHSWEIDGPIAMSCQCLQIDRKRVWSAKETYFLASSIFGIRDDGARTTLLFNLESNWKNILAQLVNNFQHWMSYKILEAIAERYVSERSTYPMWLVKREDATTFHIWMFENIHDVQYDVMQFLVHLNENPRCSNYSKNSYQRFAYIIVAEEKRQKLLKSTKK
jgi:hypothetical protein